MINKDDIIFSLELMDIGKGDILLVHSALSSIGYVEGGSEVVIDALLKLSGVRGRLSCQP